MLLAGTRRKRSKQPGRPFGGRPWDDDDKVLRRVYSTGGLEAACAALPHRTQSAILNRAWHLRITRKPRITRDERNAVCRMWHRRSPETIARKLGISRWRLALIASKEGLRSIPRECETMQHAADRSGYPVATLWRILRWHGSYIRSARSPQPRERGTGARTSTWHYVDPDHVDAAVAAWIASEAATTSEKALAEEYGVSTTLVRSEMRKAGVQRDDRGRLPKDVARETMQRWSRTLPVSIAAERLGVHPSTLQMALQDAGHERPAKARQWRVTIEDATAAIATCTRIRRSSRRRHEGRKDDAERASDSHNPGTRSRAA